MNRTGLVRIGKYVGVRAVWLALMVALGIFLSIVVVNYGGYIDQIFRADIDGAIMSYAMAGGFKDMAEDEKAQAVAEMQWNMEEAVGLHTPFLVRCVRWFGEASTFDFGTSRTARTLSGAFADRHDVKKIILQRLPNTLLLSGTANFLVFVASVSLALALSRNYGGWRDRAIVALSPLSAAPNWVYGILLIVIFAAQLHWLPFAGMFDDLPPETSWGYIPVVLRHMALPAAAIALSTFFQSVYAWRTFYLLHMADDHVEMARARGLPASMVERRYILRPTLPYLLTAFALMLMGFWQGAIALETLFDWPGIGSLLLQAIRTTDRRVTVGVIVIFAYLLGLTVFLLDVSYALVDPRVRLGGGNEAARPARTKRAWRRLFRRQPAPRRPTWTPVPRAPASGGAVAQPEPIARPRAGRNAGRLSAALRQAARFPSIVVGTAMILVLVGVAVYTVIAIPQKHAIELWQGKGNAWEYNPKNAQPAWTNWFRRDDLPETIVLDSRDGTADRRERVVSADMREIAVDFKFDYPYGALPQEIVVNLGAQFAAKRPHVVLTWLTPDGREIELTSFSIASNYAYYVSKDERLIRRLGGDALPALFSDPARAGPEPLQGTYTLRASGFVFEDDSQFDAQMVLYGQVHGWAGTDFRRRDMALPLLWGAPIALAFGLGGAVATSLATMVLAAAGAWFGGLVDDVIQRITEVNMIIPALPMAIMVYFLYSKSVWAILGVMILLNIFGSAIKNFRAVFIQIKSSPYIEAAQTYGAGSWRIVLRYMVPRILPVLLPQMVIMVPGFVFLEATLAYLGVSDPYLPTWGKVIYDALTNGAFRGYFYWILEPIVLLLLTGLAFALVGLTLERVYNPRLREQ